MAKIALSGRDIGAPAQKGATAQTGKQVSVTAGGADIWGNRDEFHFACIEMGGNFSLTAKLEALEMADPYTKAGIMLRAGSDPGAVHLMLFAFGDNKARNKNNGGIEFQSRMMKYSDCTSVYPAQPLASPAEFPVAYPDVWLRLQRRDDVYEGFVSKDGEMWRRYCQHKMVIPGTPLLGLAVTAHNAAKTVTARFSNVDYIPLE
jgi:regulation of enolase protein 1 (concanavalin A-like superfamily)